MSLLYAHAAPDSPPDAAVDPMVLEERRRFRLMLALHRIDVAGLLQGLDASTQKQCVLVHIPRPLCCWWIPGLYGC